MKAILVIIYLYQDAPTMNHIPMMDMSYCKAAVEEIRNMKSVNMFGYPIEDYSIKAFCLKTTD